MRKAPYFVIFPVIAVLSLVIIFAQTVTAEEPVQVTLISPQYVTVGQSFTASLDIDQVEKFDATNYMVRFDPNVIVLENITAGEIGTSSIPVDGYKFISTERCNVVQNVPGIAGVTGAGALAKLHFQAIGNAGASSQIEIIHGVLSDNRAQEIPASFRGSTVTLIGPSQEIDEAVDTTLIVTSPAVTAAATTAEARGIPPITWVAAGIAGALGAIIWQISVRRKKIIRSDSGNKDG